MSYIPSLYGQIDDNNSTATPLTANSVFTGTATLVTNFSSVNINITTDNDSAANGLSIEFSQNSTNWDTKNTKTLNVAVSGTAQNFTFSYNIESKYYRLVYTNGNTAQGVFRMQTLLNAQTSGVLTASSRNETVPLSCDDYGRLNTNIRNGTSIFGDIRVAQMHPLIQFDFVYGLNTNTVSTTVATGGTATSSGSMAVLSTTTTNGSSSLLQSKKYFKYRDGHGGVARFTAIFNTGVANNRQIAGCGDTVDGYFFGYNGTAFGILHRQNSVDTWYAQSAWNGDTLLGSGLQNESKMLLDPTKGNIFQIVFGYLGFAGPRFFIFNPYAGEFVLVHTVYYANLNTTTVVTNPAMTLTWQTINTAAAASTTTLRAASGAIFVDGMVRDLGPKYGRGRSRANPGTTQVAMITLRNNTTVNSLTNKAQMKILNISASVASSTAATNAHTCLIGVFTNATLGGTPSYTNIDATNSIAAFDIAGTTVTGGTQILSFNIVFTSNTIIDLSAYDIYLYPTDTMTFAITCSGSSAATLAALSVNWVENT